VGRVTQSLISLIPQPLVISNESQGQHNLASASPGTLMPSINWGRVFYVSTYYALILGIALSLLVTGYDLVQQTLALAQGGGKYFYIFILVGTYVAIVRTVYKCD